MITYSEYLPVLDDVVLNIDRVFRDSPPLAVFKRLLVSYGELIMGRTTRRRAIVPRWHLGGKIVGGRGLSGRQ